MALKTLMIVAFAAAPGACEMADTGDAAAPTGLSNIAPAALAALPQGIDSSFLIRDNNGCYGLAVERTEPQTGVALLDATGKQVCDV